MSDRLSAAGFFSNLTEMNMSAPEVIVYRLRIEREALVRSSKNYHRKRLHIQSFIEPGSAQDQALIKLNADFPMGYCRSELVAINAAISEASIALHRQRAANLQPGEHFDTRRTNLGR